MYHPTIQKLDSAANELHQINEQLGKIAHVFTGQIQSIFVASSQFKTKRRFLDAQFVWALGHIGILYQVIRWFKLKEPETQLVLETKGNVANKYFLSSIAPSITVYEILPDKYAEEAKFNTIYFACPNGVNHIHDFMKIAEKECKGMNLIQPVPMDSVEKLLSYLKISRPFVAVQARHLDHDPKRNVTLMQVEEEISHFQKKGYSIVSTGLDDHPINKKIPNVLSLDNPHLASFLLSATCDHFIGSDSGAWTIPWAYNRPVTLINDKSAAWIYE